MILCLVTDRRRLGTALGVRSSEWVTALRTQVLAGASAGVDLVHVREADLEAGELTKLVRMLVADVSGTRTRIVVNDRLDVALACGAGGVHLKERSISPGQARLLAPARFTVGCSVHGVSAVIAKAEADYFIAGTVLPTLSKRSDAYLGWRGLADVVQAASGRPVLGIGGLDLPSIPLLASTGAAGLAAIGAFVPPAGAGVSEFVQKRVIDMRLVFDSAHPVS